MANLVSMEFTCGHALQLECDFVTMTASGLGM